MSGQGWVPPVTDLMRGPFSVDWKALDGLNDHYRREMERVFLPPSLRRPEPGADCG